ncbi:MAG: hypothetical protein MUP30_08285 [Deltaproteobacteria bacterium]|nr:hypothetical protein [Deltaproteobacteria bacterium]
MDPEKAFCPNCGEEATKVGNEITCVKCDAIFTFNKKAEPKVKQIGIAERLDRLEEAVLSQKAEPAPAPDLEPELEPEHGEPDAEED